MNKHPQAAIRLWIAGGLLAYLTLPWYALQDTAWYLVLPQVFRADEASQAAHNGWLQMRVQGRWWLLPGLLGLGLAGVGAALPAGRRQGAWLLGGGSLGAVGLCLAGFAIGAKGWAWGFLNVAWGELGNHQLGLGSGAAFPRHQPRGLRRPTPFARSSTSGVRWSQSGSTPR